MNASPAINVDYATPQTAGAELSINHSLPFIPPAITHLSHSAVYETLSSKQQLRYNQLFALQMNEFAILFETIIASYYERLQSSGILSAQLAESVRRVIAQEREHTPTFVELNRRAAPELYRQGKHYFVTVPSYLRMFAAIGKRQLYFAPAIVLFVALLEERLLYYAQEFARFSSALEPNFVNQQVEHADDEVFHVNVNIALLKHLWGSSSVWRRHMNGWFARFVIEHFLLAPRRAGKKVLRRLIQEFPELGGRRAELFRALRALSFDQVFLSALYSHKTNDKSLRFIEGIAELNSVRLLLKGCGVRPG